jgi:cytochrome c peroxidase
MGGDRVSFTRTIQRDEELSSSYESLFGELPDTSLWPSSAKPLGEDSQDPMQLAWESMNEEAQRDSTQVLVNMAKAVAAFEREIVSGEAPFDRYVRGLKTGDPADLSALDEEQLFGMELFFNEARCHLCHHGPLFSDLEFHDVRLPYAVDGAGEALREFGRWEGIELVLKDPFNGLGEYSDVSPLAPNELAPNSGSARGHLEFLLRTPHTKGEFKTAGLRNVERTAPYTHRGIYRDLNEVIEHYSTLHDAPLKQHSDSEEILIALQLSEDEKRALVSFLGSLTGEISNPKLLQPPTK